MYIPLQWGHSVGVRFSPFQRSIHYVHTRGEPGDEASTHYNTNNYYGTKLHNYIDSTFHVVIPITNHKDIT